MALLVADCVAKSFGARKVLTSATLRAVSGEFRGLLGRNGAGKTTLMKIAAGLLSPDSGNVRYDGETTLTAHLAKFASNGLFFLPERNLFSSGFTLRAQLEMFRDRFDGGDPETVAARMGIANALDRRPHTLSGGERRRAELAAVLVRRPRCLLADEPYRGIAPRDAEALTAAFRALAADGCAVVVSGHEIPILFDGVSHVIWCTAGTTYELGPPELAQSNEQFRRQYLGLLSGP